MKLQAQDQNIKTEQDALQNIFKVYYSAIYKQYLVQGSGVNEICRQIKLIYDQTLNQKFLYQHLLDRNKKVYEVVVQYLNATCVSEGQPANSYNNMWPTDKLNSFKVQNQILDIPKVIWKKVGKDIHEIYNLLLQAMYDSSLIKLYQRYNLMRQLYLIMSEVFITATEGSAQQQAQIQQTRKRGKKKQGGPNVQKKPSVPLAFISLSNLNSTYKFLIEKMTPKVEQLLLKLHVCSTNQKRKIYFDKACTELVQLQLIQMTFPKNLFKSQTPKIEAKIEAKTRTRGKIDKQQCKKEAQQGQTEQSQTEQDQTVKDEIKIQIEQPPKQGKRSKSSKSQLIECELTEN